MTWQFCFGIPNAGVVALLFFLSKFFKLLSLSYDGDRFLQQFCEVFPKTLKRALMLLGISNDTFTKFIVCPSCDSVFDYEFGYIVQDGVKVPKCCPHVAMPYHTVAS